MQNKQMSNFCVMARMITLIFPLTGYMIVAVLMGVAGFLCAIFIPVTSVFLLLKGLGLVTAFTFSQVFIFLIIIAVLRGVLHYIEQACNHYIAFRLLALIRDHVFKALRSLAPAKLEGRDKGALISLITSDIELLEVFYAHTISPILIAIITCFILLLLFYQLHPIFMMLALLAYCIVGIILPIYITKLGKVEGNIYREKFGDLSSYTLESLRSMQEILQYEQGEKRLQEMNLKSKNLHDIQKNLKQHEAVSSSLSNFAVLGFSFLMLIVSLYFVSNHSASFMQAIIATVLLFSSFGPVLALSALSNNLLVTMASGRRVLMLLNEKPVVMDIVEKEATSFGDILIDDVSFAYEEEDVLKHISANIKKGTITGIHGKSGSGKSTLLKLIMRFWKVEEGDIIIKDKNINDINTSDLRNMESFVTQETCMFHDSIEANIKIANLHATDEEVKEACQKASIHDFIMSLPNGYQTQVSELGDSLSGGEKQRIAIARAFLHDGDCILLDEPTSNLDVLNEGIILESLKKTKDKTILLVSHRSSTMKIADEILHVESGRVS